MWSAITVFIGGITGLFMPTPVLIGLLVGMLTFVVGLAIFEYKRGKTVYLTALLLSVGAFVILFVVQPLVHDGFMWFSESVASSSSKDVR